MWEPSVQKVKTMSQNGILTNELIDINHAAELLAISPATVRNWVKAGKIKKLTTKGRQRLFDKQEILHLKAEIESGRSHRLKTRRNKKAAAGYALPSEYVSSQRYVELAQTIVALARDVQETGPTVSPHLILLEVALNLLHAQGGLQWLTSDQSSHSLTEQWVQNRFQTGLYQPLLTQLYPLLTQIHNQNSGLSSTEAKLLRAIRELNIPFIEGDDLLGLIYLSFSLLGQRKRRGSYYTPRQLVDQLVINSITALEQVPFPKVIDPCCGSGNFLIQLFIALRKRYLAAGYNLAAAEQLARESIAGDDIDPTAVTLAKLNLALHHQSEPSVPYQFKIRCRNSLAPESTLDPAERFDLVIGNPPWGYHFTREEAQQLKGRFVSAQTSLESFALFIEYGLSLLKEQGLLTYLLPEALLNVELHQAIRRLLLNQTNILSIQLLGHRFTQVHTPTIALTAQKRAIPSPRSSGEHYVTVEQNDGQHHVPQQRFLHNEQYIFNVRMTSQEERLITQMKTLPGTLFLKEQATFALGIVTGNNAAFLSREPLPETEPVLKGQDIFKYTLYPGQHYLLYKPWQFHQMAPEHLYRAPEKLVYRFINEHLIFAYDNKQTLTLNSANILIPQLPGYSIKYVLAVLNSRAAQFFHACSYHSVKVLRQHIETIPIPSCSPAQQAEVIHWVNQLIQERDPVRRYHLYEQIDAMMMQLYQLTEEQQQLIKSKFPKVKFLSK